MTIEAQQRSRQQHPRAYWVAAAAVAAGAMVSVALGVYGRQHQPSGQATWMFGFPSMIGMKVWLALVAGGLAVVQLTSALWLYGKLGRPAGRAVGIAHPRVGHHCSPGQPAGRLSLPLVAGFPVLRREGDGPRSIRLRLLRSVRHQDPGPAYQSESWVAPPPWPAAYCFRPSSSWCSPHHSGTSTTLAFPPAASVPDRSAAEPEPSRSQGG